MRNYLILTILILVPVLLAGSLFKGFTPPNMPPINGMKYLERTWRLNEVQEEFYTGMDWEDSGRYFYIYSQDHPTRLDTLKYSYWDFETEDWVPLFIQSITWDNTNEYVIELNQTLNFMGMLFPFVKGRYWYDNQNRLTHGLYEFYDGDLNEWITGFRIQIVYNSNTDFVVYNYQAEGEEQEIWYRQNFTWDTQGRITQEMRYASVDSLNWGLSDQTQYTYHPHDTTTGDIFVSNVAHYIPLQDITDLTNNTNFLGMLSQEVHEWWNGAGWEQERTLYTYNNDDVLTQILGQNWFSDAWTDGFLINYTYDANGNLYQKLESSWQFDMWEPETRLTCSWGQANHNDDDSVPPLNRLSIKASPNPFGSDLTVWVADKLTQPVKVSVFNTKGQLVKQLEAKTNTALVWDGRDTENRPVSSGIYYIRASVNGQTGTLRTLKLK